MNAAALRKKATRRKRIEALLLLLGPIGGDIHAERWDGEHLFKADNSDVRDYLRKKARR